MYCTKATIHVECDAPDCRSEQKKSGEDRHDAQEKLEAGGWLLDGNNGLPDGCGYSYVHDEDVDFLNMVIENEYDGRSLCPSCLEKWCEEQLEGVYEIMERIDRGEVF